MLRHSVEGFPHAYLAEARLILVKNPPFKERKIAGIILSQGWRFASAEVLCLVGRASSCRAAEGGILLGIARGCHS